MKTSFVNGGRIAVHVPGHPGANNRGYILQARYVMEQHLGRVLGPEEVVHHENGNKLDDRLENLRLTDDAAHMRQHWESGELCRGQRLDYNKVRALVLEGLGYKRIAKETGYPISSVKYAVRKLRAELQLQTRGRQVST